MKRTLVLIDWQNLWQSCEKEISSSEKFLEEIIAGIIARDDLIEIRLFVPNYQYIKSPWESINRLQLKYGVTVSVCPVLRVEEEKEEGYKDLVDFEVLRWVMNYLHKGIPPELVVFVSGDGDFTVSANEAKKRGKEVEFWIVNPETTSDTILKFQVVRKIKIPGEPIFSGENTFLTTLEKIQENKEISEKDKQNLIYLEKASKILAKAERPITPESKLKQANQKLEKELGISQQKANELLKALMALGAVRLYSAVSWELTINFASPFLQWLGLKIAPSKLSNGK